MDTLERQLSYMPFGRSQAGQVSASLFLYRSQEGREQGKCITANRIWPTGKMRSKADEAKLTMKRAGFRLI